MKVDTPVLLPAYAINRQGTGPKSWFGRRRTRSVLPLRSPWKMQLALSTNRPPRRTVMLKGSWGGDSLVPCTDTLEVAAHTSVANAQGKRIKRK